VLLFESAAVQKSDSNGSTAAQQHFFQNGSTLFPFPSGPVYFGVAETSGEMIVYHSHRLHEGITDGGAYKLKAPLFQVLAEGIRFPGARGDILSAAPSVLQGAPFDKLPKVTVKGPELFRDIQEGLGILNGGVNFQPVPYNSGVVE